MDTIQKNNQERALHTSWHLHGGCAFTSDIKGNHIRAAVKKQLKAFG